MYELDKPQSSQVRDAVQRLRSWINVARIVSDARMERGLSQAEVARLAGTKQSRVSELETLSGNLRFKTLDSIASALGLEVTLQRKTIALSVVAHQTPGTQACVKVFASNSLDATMVHSVSATELSASSGIA